MDLALKQNLTQIILKKFDAYKSTHEGKET